MDCVSCSEKLEGKFCSKCGSENPLFENQPNEISLPGNKSAVKKTRSKNLRLPFFGLITGILVAGVFGFLTYSANDSFETHTQEAQNASKEHSDALSDLSDARSLLNTVEEELASAKISEDACYYNWYCSSATYSNWVSKVSDLEDLQSSFSSLVSEATAKASSWDQKRRNFEDEAAAASQSRNIYIGLAAAGLILALISGILMIRGRQNTGISSKQKITQDADEVENLV